MEKKITIKCILVITNKHKITNKHVFLYCSDCLYLVFHRLPSRSILAMNKHSLQNGDIGETPTTGWTHSLQAHRCNSNGIIGSLVVTTAPTPPPMSTSCLHESDAIDDSHRPALSWDSRSTAVTRAFDCWQPRRYVASVETRRTDREYSACVAYAIGLCGWVSFCVGVRRRPTCGGLMIVCMRAGEHAHATGINYRPSCKHEHVLRPYRMTQTCNGAASAVGWC